MFDLKEKKMIVRSGIGGAKFKEVCGSTLIQDLLYKVAEGDVALDVARRFMKSLGDQD